MPEIQTEYWRERIQGTVRQVDNGLIPCWLTIDRDSDAPLSLNYETIFTVEEVYEYGSVRISLANGDNPLELYTDLESVLEYSGKPER